MYRHVTNNTWGIWMKKYAFTLAELLTAVLVISVIMVALAPVITKRMKDTVSVQTDNKKGLEIYANPGTYTFDVPVGINTLFLQGAGGGGGGGGSSYIDKNATFLSSSTWTVPKGVNQITFTLYGAGGGGGGGYGKTGSEDCPYIKLPGMADNGRDLCYWNKNMDNMLGYGRHGSSLYIAKPGETMPPIDQVCHRYLPGGPNLGITYRLASGSIRPEERMACSPSGAMSYCSCYLPGSIGWQPMACGGASDPAKEKHVSRLMKKSEMDRILAASPAPNFKYLTPQYLDIYAM